MTRTLDQTAKKGKQMTEEPKEVSTGAPFHGVTDWHDINWESCAGYLWHPSARIGL
jgi:hypothetical protein